MRTALLSFTVLFIAAAPSAQTAAGEDQPHVVIDTVGPDGWRIRLGPTNLGSLLESEKGREVWEPQVEPLLGMWHQLSGDPEAFAESRDLLLEYGGRIRVALWFDAHDQRRSDPAACVAVVFDGEGRSDLEAIAGELRTTLYQTIPGEWADVELGGTKCTVRRNPDSELTAPMVENGQLIIAATSEGDLELALRRARAMAQATTEKLKPNSPALRVHFDFAGMYELFMANENESEREVMDVIGLDSVGTGTLTIGTAGPRIQVEYAQAFTDDDRGVFAALLPATESIPSLLLAAGEGTWAVGHFDLLRLYEVILDALIASDLATEDPRADIQNELGLDPADDLLAHMTDNVMFWLPEAEDLNDDPGKTPWTLTWRLGDEQAFSDGLFTMLPKWRPFFQRERKETHEEVEVYRYGNTLGYDTWLTVGRGVFAIGGGRGAGDHIIEILDRCKNLPAALPDNRRIPAGFEPLQRFLPAKCHGYAVGSATNVVGLPTSLWFELLGWFLPMPGIGIGSGVDPDEDAERREALAELLKEHRLDVAHTATGFADRTWSWRMYW